MTDKKVPGSDSVFMIYDARDRLVLTSDGNSRVTNKWYYNKYDELNRPTEKGEITFTGVTRKNLVDHYKTNIQFYSSTNVKALEEFIYDVIPSVAPYNDSRYRFTQSLSNMAVQATNTKGLLVAKRMSQVRNNGISVLPLVEVYYYDKYNRVIQTVSRNYQGYFERISNVYNFAGQVIQTRTQQFYSSTSYYILDTFFKYDHRGRLIQTDYQVDGNSGNLVPRTVVSAMVYDEAGQLKTKYLHSQSNRVFLQKVDYRYNIRGWLTGINDPGLEAPESDQFGMNLYYNRGNRGGAGYYNGNIQGETWGITSYLNQVNSYTYDKLNRITGSRFGAGNAYRTYYTYDNNGNIQKLLRKAEDGVAFIDSIFYGYKINSNQLDYTRDDAGNAPGWDFPGTLLGSNHYQYDANGNMTRDDYKAINVSYNSFSLPSEIDFGNNQKLNYYYDGSGRKLTKIYTPSSYYPTNTEYRGQMVHQYSNGTGSLKYIITLEGRLLNTGTNAAPVWGWEYDLKDHLGNTRVIFKPNATNNGVVRVEYANYFPFGMKMLAPYSTFSGAKYLYNGKEMQDDFGLNWYDYGARFYDAAIGRWHSVDPMAEKYFDFSPYNYVGNNPISRIDPTGMDWYYYKDKDGNEHYKYQDGNDKSIKVGDNTYSNIGSTVSINVNDDVYINAFQNLTMTSIGESVNLKEKILNDNDLFYQYIKDGSDLSMQGRVELFGSKVSQSIDKNGLQVIKGMGAVTGGVIGGGELAALAPMLGDASINRLVAMEFNTGNYSMLKNSTYAVGSTLNNSQVGQWIITLISALAPEGTQPGFNVNQQGETILKYLKQCFEFREHIVNSKDQTKNNRR